MTQRMTKGKSEVKSNYTTRPRATAYTTVYKKNYVANLIQIGWCAEYGPFSLCWLLCDLSGYVYAGYGCVAE